MFCLLAINGNSPDVRVIAVSPTREPLKRFIAKDNTYWWTKDLVVTETPKLTWRPKPQMPWEHDDTEVALFCGNLFGKPVTELQIRPVEITGITK